MDGLEQQLTQLLSDPNSMKQLQGMLSSLGLNGAPGKGDGDPAPAQQQPSGNQAGPNMSALAGMLGALGGSQPQQPQPQAGPDTLAMVAKLAPMLSQLNREDDSTRLLTALRPLLGPERRHKIDEAVKILQLMRLLPMLRDMGGLAGLMPGLGA